MYDTTKPYKERILEITKKTERSGMPPTSTDGIGTKGIYHWQQRTFHNAVLDGLAMNLNDLLVMRSKPLYLQNHIMLPEEDDEAILEIIESFAEECGKRNIAITCGETSIHKNIQGLEISVNIIGEYINQRQNKFELGDYLIGVGSSGLHSNGFTKVMDVFGEEYRSEFVEPTIIYSDKLFGLIDKIDVNGMMHITGGAYTKLKDLLQDSDAIINNNHRLKPQNIFYELFERDISDEEMYKTFNCGTGFVLSTNKKNSEKFISMLIDFEFTADVIGEVVPGTGNVKIDSMFSDKKIIL